MGNNYSEKDEILILKKQTGVYFDTLEYNAPCTLMKSRSVFQTEICQWRHASNDRLRLIELLLLQMRVFSHNLSNSVDVGNLKIIS